MKTINVSFEDKEYRQILIRKGMLSWKAFILQIKNDNAK